MEISIILTSHWVTQQSIEYHERHLKIAIEIGDRDGEGSAYGNLVFLTGHWVTIKNPSITLRNV